VGGSKQGRHFKKNSREGKILTEFLGEGGKAKYEEKKLFAKTQTSHYFSNLGGVKCPPLPPPK